MTNSGQAMGTADYMAPEQASDSHAVDIRADIYSLGCTLYKLMAGCAPFEGSQYKGTFEKMTAHVQQTAPPIESLLPEIPRELAAIIEKMLAKDPAERFAQPADVIEALTPFCTNAALSALLVKAEEAKTMQSGEFAARMPKRSGSTAARPATQPTRRRPSILAVIGLALFVLGFGFGFSLGIIVMIKKGEKTTTIEAPEGSNVQVNEQGSVKIDLDKDQSKAAGPIEQPASEGKKSEQEKQRRTTDGKIVPNTYRLGPGDILRIYITRSGGGLGDRVMLGNGGIETSKTGIANLGPKYGEVNLQGLSLDEAERAIEKKDSG